MNSLYSDRNLLLSLVLVTCAGQVHAACSRDDVEFYLGKGFSADQITELCKTSSDCNQAVSKSSARNVEKSSGSILSKDDELFLKTAIKGHDIHLSSDSLRYTQKMCIEYGEEDVYGFTPKHCPDVKFTVTLKGLEVLKTGKKYLFYGAGEVRIRSKIKREIIGELDDLDKDVQRLIFEKLEQGDKTAIPVREDMSMERVKQILQQLSR